MNSHVHLSGYKITTDPAFQHERLSIPPELIEQYEELHLAAKNKKNKKIIGRLTGLILKYPQSPQLKNFLMVAYHLQGNHKKATEINNRTIMEHPDYLFAKLNLAFQYIADGQAEKVPEVLGEAMELKELYPERDLFHIGEVTGFYKAAIYYFVAIKNLELAENRLEVLNGIAPGHPDTKSAELFLFPLRVEKNMERWTGEDAAKFKVNCLRSIPSSKQKTPPFFNHAEINNLYEYGLDIPAGKLKQILALPRETVIADLEKILMDSIDRYQYFTGLGYGEDTHSFPLHAICLLAELGSENSLPAVLDFLENCDEVLEFWLGDHLTSTLWLPVYLLSQNNTELLKQFSIKPGIDTHSKTVVTDALAQIVLHQPEKRNEVVRIFREILSYFSLADLNDNIIDSDFLGLAIGNIIDCGFVELQPPIKELYEKKYVSLQVNGPYEEVAEFIKNPAGRDYKKNIENIFELYENIINNWAGYSEDEDDYFEDEEIHAPAVSFKIGRNDPCPCGSGKKYKKCCIDKLPLL